MKGFKGFAHGLVCRGKQYAENTIFEEPDAEICKSGMHFCENPFDVLDYYDLVNADGSFNDFAEVEALDEAKTDDHKKFCTTKLRIGAKLSFSGFVNACVDFMLEKTKGKNDKDKIGSSGDVAKIGSSGSWAQICSSGEGARIGSSGSWAQICSSGSWAQIGSSGEGARIGSSGSWARIGSSGSWARIGSSGERARIGSSGERAQIGSSGEGARIGSSGEGARIGSLGADSVICCAGHGCKVRAKKGSWITLSEWAYSEEKQHSVPVCVKTEFVDGEKIKEDVFYMLKGGKFVEVRDEES